MKRHIWLEAITTDRTPVLINADHIVAVIKDGVKEGMGCRILTSCEVIYDITAGYEQVKKFIKDSINAN